MNGEYMVEEIQVTMSEARQHMLSVEAVAELVKLFGKQAKLDEPLARFTTARLGGPAQILLEAKTAHKLSVIVDHLWRLGIDFKILGGGSNVLVSDTGVNGLILLNRQRGIGATDFSIDSTPPKVLAESGVSFSLIARRAAEQGLTGLEWAAGIPGTLGGAVVGNAGAHGRSMADNLLYADILMCGKPNVRANPERVRWYVDQFQYAYRHSKLKHDTSGAVVLDAALQLEHSTPEHVRTEMERLAKIRQKSQPHGASVGSIFKNPQGDFAGRLIEAAGLKGLRVGDAEISRQHANFFINLGNASSSDFFGLICLARQRVARCFGVMLELEVELWGQFPEMENFEMEAKFNE